MKDLICGIHPVLECLRSRSRLISRLYFAEETNNREIRNVVRLARQLGHPIHFEPRRSLDRRVEGVKHQGVVAICATQAYIDIRELIARLGPKALVVVLDSIVDPRNLGAILRCCAAAAVDGVILRKDHAANLTTVVSKASAGGIEHLMIARVTNLGSAIDLLKDKGLWVTGVETGQDIYCQDMDFDSPLAVVFGNEEVGLRRLIRQKCDFLVSVPTPGPICSLNVSVATGIVLYEVTRQRYKIRKKNNL